ncbi:biopolymer transporter Tol [Kribbella solani]|uniref:TolB family protein n=1 Tax=Kribbella solani TaxID=236067 RepID=UPI0029A992E2|nr:biopolymer transporter Tol [Kribbella solani]MDX3006272.1 biopolymer transporter Tol [Kribbella solani]
MPNYRTLATGQRSQVWIGGPGRAEPELLFETSDLLIEAPNWSLDGSALLVNGNGALWRLDVAAPGLSRIEYDDLPDINNDHVLDPDGEHIYLSAMDGHIYRGAITGGAVQRVTPDDGKWHFLHGVAPDGQRLAYVEISTFAEPGRLAIIEPNGSPTIVDTGAGHLDGPEWSADGKWIYFNTETFTGTPGHAQLARIADSGGATERLVTSDTVDWFPHVAPDARHATYISFPAGTLGHPADLDVEVRVVSTADWSVPLQRYPLFGGQGTINVNSWSPDNERFAFVSYPVAS